MHFAEDSITEPLFIKSYQTGLLTTNAGQYNTPVVLFQGQTYETLLPTAFAQLNSAHFQSLVDLSPELILVGSGNNQAFPKPVLLEPLFKKRIGFEVMTTDAACRTFNLLLAEGRLVLAALFV